MFNKFLLVILSVANTPFAANLPGLRNINVWELVGKNLQPRGCVGHSRQIAAALVDSSRKTCAQYVITQEGNIYKFKENDTGLYLTHSDKYYPWIDWSGTEPDNSVVTRFLVEGSAAPPGSDNKTLFGLRPQNWDKILNVNRAAEITTSTRGYKMYIDKDFKNTLHFPQDPQRFWTCTCHLASNKQVSYNSTGAACDRIHNKDNVKDHFSAGCSIQDSAFGEADTDLANFKKFCTEAGGDNDKTYPDCPRVQPAGVYGNPGIAQYPKFSHPNYKGN